MAETRFQAFVVNGLLTLTQRTTCSHCFRRGVRGPEQYVIQPSEVMGKPVSVMQRMIVRAAVRHFQTTHPDVTLPTVRR